MTRYNVPFTTYAGTSVDVDVPDDVTDPHEIAQIAEAKLYEAGTPTLCHQCSGGRHGSPTLEIGDDWQPYLYNGTPDITRLD